MAYNSPTSFLWHEWLGRDSGDHHLHADITSHICSAQSCWGPFSGLWHTPVSSWHSSFWVPVSLRLTQDGFQVPLCSLLSWHRAGQTARAEELPLLDYTAPTHTHLELCGLNNGQIPMKYSFFFFFFFFSKSHISCPPLTSTEMEWSYLIDVSSFTTKKKKLGGDLQIQPCRYLTGSQTSWKRTGIFCLWKRGIKHIVSKFLILNCERGIYSLALYCTSYWVSLVRRQEKAGWYIPESWTQNEESSEKLS